MSAELPLHLPSTLAGLRDVVSVCERCRLHHIRKNSVFGEGTGGGICFIGEAPGRKENETGYVFWGQAGRWLTKGIRAIGLERRDCYICNMVKCKPPNNRDPLADELMACRPYLERQLELVAPKVICCLGRVAGVDLGIVEVSEAMGSVRGEWRQWDGIPAMATYHPAYIARQQHLFETWIEDLRKLRSYA